MGPAFKDIAAKYKGDKSAPAKLTERFARVVRVCGAPSPCPLMVLTRSTTTTSRALSIRS